MKQRILFSWIGMTDLRCSRGEQAGLGPLAQAATAQNFQRIYLLVDSGIADAPEYVAWLSSQTKATIRIVEVKLASPTHYEGIYRAVVRTVKLSTDECKGETFQRTYHLSPGTPAMCAVWLLVSKTIYPALLLESSERHGVKEVDVPFDIAMDFMPERSPKIDIELRALTEGLPPVTAELDAIVHRSKEMQTLLARARRIAAFDYPVLIQGESGTGKEMLAKAIHSVSHQRNGPFVPVNCGAIPESLVEAQFFGYKKGAFTGAAGDQLGFVEAANGGTLFLDEIGELPRQAQVKLLRFLQEGTFQRVGDPKERRVQVRVVAATNRDLLQEVISDRFREDLFHRLAFGVLSIPPIRERRMDIDPLVNTILTEINAKCSMHPGWKRKKLSAGARNLATQHPWPGNVRELNNTLVRAAMWAADDTIRTDDLRNALFLQDANSLRTDGILNRTLDENCDLQAIMQEVARHYLLRSLESAQGNKTEAAKLVGLPSYQTFTNWLKKYAVKTDEHR